MAKKGLVDGITEETEEKEFEGSGIEASKGFDKTGANCVVTHRSGPKKVWFRDGKEIGVEDA
jgi:hypothetical protein